jgi:hypothetical protein
VRWRKCVERQGDYVEKWYTCVPLLFNKSHVKKYLRFSFDSPSYFTVVRFQKKQLVYHTVVCHYLFRKHQSLTHLMIKYLAPVSFNFCKTEK